MHKNIVGVTVDGGTSSGVVIGPGQVATCYHVVNPEHTKPCGNIVIHYQDKEYPAKIIRAEKNNDLCLLEAPGLPAPAIKIADTAPVKGEHVTVLGMPSGHFETSEGHIENFSCEDDAPVIFSNATIRGGFSGGALVSDRDELVGINFVSSGLGMASSTASIPAAWVRKLIDRTDNELSLSKSPTEISRYREATLRKQAAEANQQEGLPVSMQETWRYMEDWLKACPDSYLAHLCKTDCINIKNSDLSLEQKKECYQSAVHILSKSPPSDASVFSLALIAEKSGTIPAALDIYWQLTEKNAVPNDFAKIFDEQRWKQILFEKIISGSLQLPRPEGIQELKRVIACDSAGNETKARAYGSIGALYSDDHNPDMQKALAAFKSSLLIDPNYTYASRMIEQIEGMKQKSDRSP